MNIVLFNKRYTSSQYNQYKVQIGNYPGPYHDNIKEAIEECVKCYIYHVKYKSTGIFERWVEDINTKIILQFNININNSDLDENDLLIKFAEVIPEELL